MEVNDFYIQKILESSDYYVKRTMCDLVDSNTTIDILIENFVNSGDGPISNKNLKGYSKAKNNWVSIEDTRPT